MTAPTPANTGSHVPWRVRWAFYATVVFCLAAIPGTTRSLALRVIEGAAQVAGIDQDEPVLISPTNPPVVDQ